MSETVCKETNMNIVAKSDYNFHGMNIVPVQNVTGIWLTSADIAKALGYKSTKSISNLFSQYEDEFSQGMTMVIESMTNGVNGSTRRMKVRVFSLRGAHLVAMFARTPVAKEFRRWVLDILDREIEQSPIAKQFTDEELCTLAYLWRSSAVMYEACKEIHPLIAVAEHRLLPRFTSIGTNYARGINKAREILHRETRHIEEQPWGDSNWKNVFSYGRNTLQ
ncbi:P22AR C-terminal domain-containing protein [Citrobacter sp. Cf042]|uniref:P22AR C-terminal domain-containing protein n=1 Tax=Citrobacter sp. Cf042 TaxID=2985045 RepID=UPI002581B4B0|nr:P22AR C-terminal domain-containing protein [Citrobacter sp. Cf042]MDM3287219.1 BRO family protein [Citrobacter sp. Cf042]